ncbi:phage tail protein, partial [Escherichia coli]
DIVETINGELRQMTLAGQLLGGKAWFDATRNPIDQLSAGKLLIDYDYTAVPPLEALGLNQRITDSYFADFAAAVAA